MTTKPESPDSGASGCICQWCGRPYCADLMVPDDVWAKISDGANLLCPSCIANNIVASGIWTALRAGDVDNSANALVVEDDLLRDMYTQLTLIGLETKNENLAGRIEVLTDRYEAQYLNSSTEAADRAKSTRAQDAAGKGMEAWPTVRGCGRDADHDCCLTLFLARKPTDDELRNIHDALNGRFPLPAKPAQVGQKDGLQLIEDAMGEIHLRIESIRGHYDNRLRNRGALLTEVFNNVDLPANLRSRISAELGCGAVVPAQDGDK